MASSSRSMILSRRANPVADRRATMWNAGTLTIDEAVAQSVLTENAVFHCGIATATETRLDASRYPIQIIVGAAPTTAEKTCISCGYWRVIGQDGAQAPFQRASGIPDQFIAHLRRHIPDLDSDWWEFTRKPGVITREVHADWDAQLTRIYNAFSVPSPPDEAITDAQAAYAEIMASANTTLRRPFIRIGTNQYIIASPVGRNSGSNSGVSSSKVAVLEAAFCAQVNYTAMKTRHPACPEGALTLAAWAVAQMFRAGLQETYEHKEYVSVYVTLGANNTATVNSVNGPAAYEVPASLAVGQILTLGDVKIDKNILELSNSLVFTSGLMHYLFNHTTGGMRVTGTLLSVLAMNGIIGNATPDAEVEDITSLMYEALHPVNKRAVADIMFPSAKVYSHGKSNWSKPYGEFILDSFIQIRRNPYPAGSHKAFTFVLALRRVLQFGIGPFLPWASSIGSLVAMAEAVLKSGAGAHIGSRYYTGRSPNSQSSNLDQYIPEVAQFMQTFHKNDSLSASPHLGPDIASKAAASWINLMKTLKKEDLSSASVDQVQAFLKVSGKSVFNISLDDPATWTGALETSHSAVGTIDSIFTH